MNFWNNFAKKHPAVAKWVREGGLFVIVSNAITVFKYLLLTFLPAAFAFLGNRSFGWPGIPLTIAGETFQWNILGYDQAHGGLAYFTAYVSASISQSRSSGFSVITIRPASRLPGMYLHLF